MRLLPRIVATGSLLALALAGIPIAAGVASAGSDVVGHLYVNDNTTGTNTIAAFDRHANGSLTALPGSPFPAGGAGTGAGIGSQGALQVSSDGRYLLAVDAASNQISVLRIRSDGTLKAVKDSPVSSAGIEPVSIAVQPAQSPRGPFSYGADRGQELVYVANTGNGGSNYTGFTLGREGQLRPLAGSTVALPDGSSPGDILFNADGTHLGGPASTPRSSTASPSPPMAVLAQPPARRSLPRASVPSAANSARQTPGSCSSPTPTGEPTTERCRRSATPPTAH